ncbi:uncharacterized protein F5147DRAFT_763943 [Suillus discolor]|uniref:Uncharacterized protein n=1 Tax=Suillus discolor TaxID=1912936 RepID=A0A9P7EX70_9AGAM|nr:uncharacterized protein F5147DRAFT_763943 [Suillus discolor]KAG2094050.1 hypothetical protein F5147DRAFT_763943 [Suillus discolor]
MKLVQIAYLVLLAASSVTERYLIIWVPAYWLSCIHIAKRQSKACIQIIVEYSRPKVIKLGWELKHESFDSCQWRQVKETLHRLDGLELPSDRIIFDTTTWKAPANPHRPITAVNEVGHRHYGLWPIFIVVEHQDPYAPLRNGHVEAPRTFSAQQISSCANTNLLTILPAGSLQPAGSVQLGFGYQQLDTSQACMRITDEMDLVNRAALSCIKSTWLGWKGLRDERSCCTLLRLFHSNVTHITVRLC